MELSIIILSTNRVEYFKKVYEVYILKKTFKNIKIVLK
jgi:hypothetical protein